ncbi:hypothetical protein EVAR_53263_1 [Eumeta japonica]|uniref:Uncharacterized protein n=1 Tax=Eumeta variegata TaxID=151549 RepID=A0A4C1YGF0_EUMVA|nr:hypothetical protein EVAR_53263_1 [Eumeta japonica]
MDRASELVVSVDSKSNKLIKQDVSMFKSKTEQKQRVSTSKSNKFNKPMVFQAAIAITSMMPTTITMTIPTKKTKRGRGMLDQSKQAKSLSIPSSARVDIERILSSYISGDHAVNDYPDLDLALDSEPDLAFDLDSCPIQIAVLPLIQFRRNYPKGTHTRTESARTTTIFLLHNNLSHVLDSDANPALHIRCNIDGCAGVGRPRRGRAPAAAAPGSGGALGECGARRGTNPITRHAETCRLNFTRKHDYCTGAHPPRMPEQPTPSRSGRCALFAPHATCTPLCFFRVIYRPASFISNIR